MRHVRRQQLTALLKASPRSENHGSVGKLMITYSVTVSIEPATEQEWLDWMQRVHVPDVLRAGCFSECRIGKALETEGAEPTYVLQYRCASLADYERYREQFAPALQKDHTDRYAGRFRASRQLLEEIAQLSPEDAQRA